MAIKNPMKEAMRLSKASRLMELWANRTLQLCVHDGKSKGGDWVSFGIDDDHMVDESEVERALVRSWR